MMHETSSRRAFLTTSGLALAGGGLAALVLLRGSPTGRSLLTNGPLAQAAISKAHSPAEPLGNTR